GERRRLAASRRTRDEDEPVLLSRHLLEGVGELEVLHGRDVGLELPEDQGQVAALGEDVDAEARASLQVVRAIARAFLHEHAQEPPVAVHEVEGEDLRLKWAEVLDGRIDGYADELA